LIMTFLLQSELTTNDNGFIEKNRYEILFVVELLRLKKYYLCFKKRK